MTLIPVKTPLVAKIMFPSYVWDIANNAKTIYLTFDDGPTPEITPWTLQTLKQYHAKATFFCIGKNIEANPRIFQSILNDGHTVGNHSYNHIKGWKTKPEDYIKNVALCESVFKNHSLNFKDNTLTSKNQLLVNLFRPPYGQIMPNQGKKLILMGYKIIMWDVLSFDWDESVSQETCLKHVISKAKSGSIIVFHDSIKAFKNLQYALPKALDYFSNKGFVFNALNR